jgi:hypothetical protein
MAIAMAPQPIRRPRTVTWLAVAVASLLCASGTVLTERLTGRDLSELLADVIRPESDPSVAAHTDEVVGRNTDTALAPASVGSQPASPEGASAAESPAANAPSAGAGTRPNKSGGSNARATGGGNGPAAGSVPDGSAATNSGANPGGAVPGLGGGTILAADGRHPLEHEVDALEPFVEREAAHTFKSPVPVRVLPAAEFSSRLAELNWLPRGEAAEQLEGVYRALGLIDATVDLPTELAKFSRPEFVTIYDAVAGELLIRDGAADPFLRAMLVRELTRALDDQYFDIYRPGGAGFAEEALEGLKALAEGDATRVYDSYKATLSATDRDLVAQKNRIAAQATSDMNRAVRSRFTYFISQSLRLVQAILGAGGRSRLDAAFAAPPMSSEQVLHPDRYLAGDTPRQVPEPGADGPVVSRGVMGQIGLYVMLSEAIDETTASLASQGWGGDRYIAWQDGTRTCVRQTIVTDTPRDATELGAALHQWAQSRPGAEVTGSGPFTIKRCA